jgi:DNA-directed RNA polymerase subunit RPC12/RpoP
MPAFCQQCGAKLPGDSRFCHGCGAALSVAQGTPDTKPLPTVLASTQSTLYPWNYIDSGRVHRSSSIGAAVHYLFCAVILVVIFVVFLVFVPWFIGMVVFGVVLVLFEKGRRRYGVRSGACPHCGEMVSISSHFLAINCPICTKRIFVSGEELRPV